MGDSLSHLDDLLILDSNSVHNYLTVVFLRRKKPLHLNPYYS